MALTFPEFDPVAIHLGPLAIRWYALAYIAGLLGGWRLLRRLAVEPPAVANPGDIDDFLSYATFGVILGGRLGYVLFYQPSRFAAHPLEILQVWTGGMSFHGGFLGVCAATILFARSRHIALWRLADIIAVVAPIGLGLGRLANFINGELWGRPAPPDLPWAMIFPHVDALPRHPSQLYQAAMEGVLLFILLYTACRTPALRARTGFLTGLFFAGYGVFRIIGEFFREPDAFLGPVLGQASMGQLLSAPMVLAGIVLMLRARPSRNGS